ncbi:MAG: hypothetical protein GTO17_01610 [Candidatus Aminicenantes bacterium]|nr:hypothetical protein [Candidatus Aminicenantes bacterium]
MEQQKPGMFVPALIGGAAAGVLSGIPLVNCLCCLWIIGGAMLASYILSKSSPVALTAGDGAIVGIFTGIIAAVIDAIVSIPLAAVNRKFMMGIMEKIGEYADEMPAGWESWLESGGDAATFSMQMIGLLISAVVFAALGTLGGIIGISLFGKKTLPKDKEATDVVKDAGDRKS